MITDEMVRRAATEYLSHRGERPYRVTRRGAELWEDHAPAMRAALEAALSAQVQDVAVGKELGRFELWFFQHLSDDQRTALFALNGYPTTGMDTHGKQKIALKHWFSRLPAAPAKQESGE